MLISESEFDDTDNLESAGVAISDKHAYKKVVIKPSNLNPTKNNKASPSQMISDINPAKNLKGSNMLEYQAGDRTAEHPAPAKNLDKINNLVQKEIALSRVGVTREKAYRVISQSLEAKKWTDVVDEQGNVRREYVDDLEKQKWGAEMAVKMFGDMIERKEIEMDVGDKTLDRLRSLSVSELKSRAADILLGKRVGTVVEAEVVK